MSLEIKRVLLVEDEPAHAELIRRAFEDNKRFDLAIASNLEEARKLISSVDPSTAKSRAWQSQLASKNTW